MTNMATRFDSIIDLDEADLVQPRPGTEVKAKVLCGTEPIGYVWFHELIEFIQSTLLF